MLNILLCVISVYIVDVLEMYQRKVGNMFSDRDEAQKNNTFGRDGKMHKYIINIIMHHHRNDDD